MRAGRSVQEASASAASTVRLHYKGHVNSPEDIYQPRSCCSFAIVGSEQQTFTQSPVVGHSQLGVTDQRLNVIFSQQHCHLDLEVFLVFLLPFRACQHLWQVVEDKLCQPEVLFPLSPTTVHQVLNLHVRSCRALRSAPRVCPCLQGQVCASLQACQIFLLMQDLLQYKWIVTMKTNSSNVSLQCGEMIT